MKTILTTIFAIALMVFAFNGNSAMAAVGDVPTKEECRTTSKGDPRCFGKYGIASVDQVKDPDQEGNERDVADSGEEGSTSAVGTDEQ